MTVPPLITAQEVIEEGFNERASYMRAKIAGTASNSSGDVQFVVQKWLGYVLSVVSNQGEHEIFLRSQLYSIFRLLQMKFGPNALQKKQSPFFLKQKKALQNLIDLNSHYFTTNQAFLVHSAEHVDLNASLYKQCQGELAKVLRSLPRSSHAILFVGTKIVCCFQKAEYLELNPQDVSLLLLYAQSEFHPLERAVGVDDVPVADYTDHAEAAKKVAANNAAVFAAAAAAGVDAAGGTATNGQGKDEMTKNNSNDNNNNNSNSNNNNNNGKTSTPPDGYPFALSVEDPKMDQMALLRASFSETLEPLKEFPDEKVSLEREEDPVSGLVGASSASGTPPAQFSLDTELEEDSKSAQQLSSDSPSAGGGGGRGEAQVPKPPHVVQASTTTTTTNTSTTSSSPAAVTLTSTTATTAASEKLPAQKPEPTVVNLFLRVSQSDKKNGSASLGSSLSNFALAGQEEDYRECRVFLCELHPSLNLVITMDGKKADPEESHKLKLVEGYLKSRKSLGPYFDFLVTKERSHVSMLSYCHQFPGLVHFLLVDRTHHRVIAPSINPLFGQNFEGQSEELAEAHRKSIMKHVWKMTSVAQQYLAKGYTASHVKESAFQYYYEMFVEDHNSSNKLTFPAHLPLALFESLALDANFYTALIAKAFPTTNPKPRCYELYALYLGTLSSATVNKYNSMLLANLRMNFPSYFGVAKV